MAWLKMSFSPVSGTEPVLAGCGLAGLAFLTAARFAGREARVFFTAVFFALDFFMVGYPTSFLSGRRKYGRGRRQLSTCERTQTDNKASRRKMSRWSACALERSTSRLLRTAQSKPAPLWA